MFGLFEKGNALVAAGPLGALSLCNLLGILALWNGEGEMLSRQDRRLIMRELGEAIDELVHDLYSSSRHGFRVIQESEITARICQRVEDRLDNRLIGDYVLRVTAQTMADRGPNSLEKLTGADLLLSISLGGPDGFDKTILVQAKYDSNVVSDELLDACERMQRYVGATGTSVWIYESAGVKVLTPYEIRQMQGNTIRGLHRRTVSGLVGRILDCRAGSKKWGIPMGPNRRQIVRERLQEVRARNALDIAIKPAR